jgi:ribosomal protein S12 methylthiotransferase accessory factor
VPGLSQAHGGQGAHLNSTVAVVRALLELAQSRAVDIQGVREDILPASAIASPRGRDMQRVAHPNRRRWVLQQSGTVRPFQALASVENEDLSDDIHLLLSNLARAGLQQVLVIPFAAPAGLAVVRVIVPGPRVLVRPPQKNRPAGTRVLETVCRLNHLRRSSVSTP